MSLFVYKSIDRSIADRQIYKLKLAIRELALKTDKLYISHETLINGNTIPQIYATGFNKIATILNVSY